MSGATLSVSSSMAPREVGAATRRGDGFPLRVQPDRILGGRGTDAAEVVLEGAFGVCGDSGDESVNAALGGQDEEGAGRIEKSAGVEAGMFEVSAGTEAGLSSDMMLLEISSSHWYIIISSVAELGRRGAMPTFQTE
jgi:hypothetical protein